MNVPSLSTSEDKVTLVLVTRERPYSRQFEGLGRKHDAEAQCSSSWLDVGWKFWSCIGPLKSQDMYVGLSAAGNKLNSLISRVTIVKKKHNLSRMHKKTTYRPRLFVYIYICDLCMHIIYICIYKLLYKYLGLFAPLEAQDSKVKLIVLPSLLSSVFSKKNHHLLKVLVTGKSMSKWH